MNWDKESVKNLRTSMKLTQSEFAEILGCRQQTISEWEQGLYTPANAYGKLLTQIRAQSPGGFVLPVKNLPAEISEIVEDFKPFDPAVD